MAVSRHDIEYVMRVRDQATKSLAAIELRLGKIDRAMKHMGDTTEKSARRGTNAIRALTAALSGLAAIRFGKEVVTFGAEFEREMALVGTLSREAAASLDPLSEGVRRLAIESGQDLASLAKAEFDVVSATGDVVHSMEMLQVATELAVAGGTDVATAIKGLGRVMNAYGLELTDAREISDALFQGMAFGQVTIEELTTAIGTVAPQAEKAGVSMQELMAAMGGATKVLEARIAATSLRMFFAKIESATDEQRQLAREMGEEVGVMNFEFSRAGIEADGLAVFLQKLAKVTRESTGRMRDLGFDIRSLQGANVLMADSARLATQAMEYQSVAAGKTRENYELLLDTTGVKIEKVNAMWKEAKLVLFEEFLGPIETGLDATNTQLEEFRGTVRRVADMLKFMGAVWNVAYASLRTGILGATALFFEFAAGVESLLDRFGLIEEDARGMMAAFAEETWDAVDESVEDAQYAYDDLADATERAFGPKRVEDVRDLGAEIEEATEGIDEFGRKGREAAEEVEEGFHRTTEAVKGLAAFIAETNKVLFELDASQIEKDMAKAHEQFVAALKALDIGDESLVAILTGANPEDLGLAEEQMEDLRILTRSFHERLAAFRERVARERLKEQKEEDDALREERIDFMSDIVRLAADAEFDLTQFDRDATQRRVEEVKRRYAELEVEAKEYGLSAIDIARAREAEITLILLNAAQERAANRDKAQRDAVRDAKRGYDFSDGFVARLGELEDGLNRAGAMGAQAADIIVDGFGTGVADSFFEAIEGAESFGDAMQAVAASVLKDLGHMMIRALAMRAILAGFGYVGIEAGALATPTQIPTLGSGGVVSRPTLALIGESGPEAVVPLDRAGAIGGGGQVVMHTTYEIHALDSRSVADMLVSHGDVVGNIVKSKMANDRGMRHSVKDAARR